MSAFTEAVERHLKGVDHFSVGVMKGCPECGLPDEALEHHVVAADEGGFSWMNCDSCGSALAGMRYPAHGLVKNRFGKDQRIHLDVCVDCLQYHANGDEPEEWE